MDSIKFFILGENSYARHRGWTFNWYVSWGLSPPPHAKRKELQMKRMNRYALSLLKHKFPKTPKEFFPRTKNKFSQPATWEKQILSALQKANSLTRPDTCKKQFPIFGKSKFPISLVLCLDPYPSPLPLLCPFPLPLCRLGAAFGANLPYVPWHAENPKIALSGLKRPVRFHILKKTPCTLLWGQGVSV